MRISFDPDSRTVVESCNAASSRPSAPLIRRVRLTALMTAVEPQQPCYLGVPPSFRTADLLGSIPERREIYVSETSEVFAGVS
jgi:hypothetical protein